jgi:hypothetical protein
MNKSRIPSLILSVLLLLFVLPGLQTNAQTVTKTADLQKASQQLREGTRAAQKILITTALQKGWPLTIRGKNGRLGYLRGIDNRGFPYYITTVDNIISAATIRTNTLWPSGSTGLNLNGSSASLKGKIAVWDEGLVRPTHVELVGRVVQEDASLGDTILSDHSTHVSGTMIATGINPVAKGMAFGAQQLQCYSFDFDDSEMMVAAGRGLLVSNHSYADITGWNFDDGSGEWQFWGMPGDTVDINFGQYNQQTQVWDSISYLAPYYLIAKAAGNSPGDTGPPVGTDYWRRNAQGSFVDAGKLPAGISTNAGYMTIATYGNAKNILCVGAVNPIPGGYSQPSDVVAAYFTSLGPTGDGRIKPDVVADGVNVLSTVSSADNAYDILSGTSMATPASAGSALLLQEYYSKLHSGVFMKSATLRGLLIHTADEAGNAPGPDYTYGWGLVDIQSAAGVITSDNTDHSQTITESSLTQGSQDSQTWVVTASGKTPVKATICWTDPPGTPPVIPSNEHNFKDTVLKLVNDLDLRITDNVTGKVYMPWILNPAKPGAAATKGDNFRDNVEKVELNDSLIPDRTYTITVTHKKTLARGSQAFSILVSGVGGTTACTSSSTSGGADITAVTLSNLSNSVPTNSSCPGYVDFTALTPANLAVGGTIPISISTASCNATNNDRIVEVYIDYNNDGVFEANELVYTSAATLAGSVGGSIIIPDTAVVGSYSLMRVIAEETNNPAVISPCGTYTNGETQDYRVVFVSPPNDVGVTQLEYPTMTTCANDSQLVAIHIHNFGSVGQNSVPVTTVVSSGGNTVATLTATCTDSIPPGGEVIFTYNTSFPSTAGTSYTFMSWTSLSSDPNTFNDSNSSAITVNPAGPTPNATATICGTSAKSVQLHATTNNDDVAFWYDSQNATVPIAAGNNTTTTEITPNKTYYVGLNDLTVKGGPPNKNYFASTVQTQGGAYFGFQGNFVIFNTSVPLTIESAKMYIGHSGKIGFLLAQLASLDDVTGEYSYLPIDSVSVDVYATTPTPQFGQVNVPAGSTADSGATFLINMPIPNPGAYIIIFTCHDSATAFLNANIPKNENPYPITIPGVFSITGNDFRDYGNHADTVTYSETFYYPFYDIGLRLEGCPGPRTSVTAGTEASPSITFTSSNVLASSAATGNQWYLNDSVLLGSTGQQLTVQYPGVYYTIVTDTATGCQLMSNPEPYTPPGGGNASIGLRVQNPSNGSFQLAFFFSTSDDLAITLTDMLGQKVYENDMPGFQGQFNQQIAAGNLANGIYVLRIFHGGNTYQEKLLILH